MGICCFLVSIQRGFRWSLHQRNLASFCLCTIRVALRRLVELWQVHSTGHLQCMEAMSSSPYIACNYCHRFSWVLLWNHNCHHSIHLFRTAHFSSTQMLLEEGYAHYRLLYGQRIFPRSWHHRYQIYHNCWQCYRSHLRYTFDPNHLVYDGRARVRDPFIYHLLCAQREHGIQSAKESSQMIFQEQIQVKLVHHWLSNHLSPI